jgi:hypothetical protein
VGEDARRWCAATGDDEREKGKDVSKTERDMRKLILFF